MRHDVDALISELDCEAFYTEYFGELPAPGHDDQVTVRCCFHDDTKPSLRISMLNGMYHCLACKASGNVCQFLAESKDIPFPHAVHLVKEFIAGHPLPEDMREQKRTGVVKPDPEPIKEFVVDIRVNNLRKEDNIREYLHTVRGLDDDTIESYHLGWDGERICLPVKDIEGQYRNIRRYLINAKELGQPKFLAFEDGYGRGRLYPCPIVPAVNSVVLCEGEFDCLLMRQMGFDAYTSTSGANSIPPDLPAGCEDKDVVIIYDNDKAGKDGAKRVASVLEGRARSIKIVNLPVTAPGTDITDWIVCEGHTVMDMAELISDTPELAMPKPYITPVTYDIQTDILGLVPKNSFFADYIEYGKMVCDAPVEFHLATSLAVVAALLGNKVSAYSWGSTIHPNLWCLMIASSGFYRKSTCMRIGLRVLERMEHVLLPSDFTPEAFFTELEGRSSGLISISEFGGLLEAMNSKQYMGGTKELLTDIYDNPPRKVKKLQTASYEIKDPAISIIGCSTLHWLFDRVKENDIRGGFFARFLFFPAHFKSEWKGYTGSKYNDKLYALQDWAYRLSRVEGVAELGDKEKDCYDAWSQRHEAEVLVGNLPEGIDGFYTRLETAVLKIAMCYQAALDGSTIISLGVMEDAIATAEYLKGNLVTLLRDELIVSPEGIQLKKVRELIYKYPGINEAYLLRSTHYMARKLEGLLETLIRAGQIIVRDYKFYPNYEK